MDEKDDKILKLESAKEEFERTRNKDQMIISFRDKTIEQLKSNSGLNIEKFNTQQVNFLKEEKELLEYKLKFSNAELESYKSKWLKLEKEIDKNEGNVKFGGTTLKEVLVSIVNLNELTQEYLWEFSANQSENKLEGSTCKRISDVSFYTQEEKKEMEAKLEKANEEIKSLKEKLAESANLISSKNDEIKEKIDSHISLSKSKHQIEEQFEAYKKEINNITQWSEQE